jgi:pimeloyl-ACP methyl ester carboxylesterase
MITVGAVELCIQTFGDRRHPAVLLIHGACASMVWWEAELCERIAAGGRFVIRYDQRDTGRSTSFPVGRPGYAMSDLAQDAVGLLDALAIERAHVVGRSMSGGTALFLAVDHPDRVASVTFMSTTTGDDGLPSPTRAFIAADTGDAPEVDDVDAMVEHVTQAVLAYHGTSPLADEDHVRSLARIDVERTRDLAASMTNHFAMEFDGPRKGGFAEVSCPALVVHGAVDPAFPVEHGRALQAALPGSRLVVLEEAGHELPVARWDEFVDALLGHTAAQDTTDGTHAPRQDPGS